VSRQRAIPSYEDALSPQELRSRRERERNNTAASGGAAGPSGATPTQQQESTSPPAPPLSTAIADQPVKTPGGKVLHNCRKHRQNHHACLRAGCIRECVNGGHFVPSSSPVRKCRTCNAERRRREREERGTQAVTGAAAAVEEEKPGEQDAKGKDAHKAAQRGQVKAEDGVNRRDDMSSGGGWYTEGLSQACSGDDVQMAYPLERSDRLEFGELVPGDNSLMVPSSEGDDDDDDKEDAVEKLDFERRDEGGLMERTA
jgi:hypothetical protein